MVESHGKETPTETSDSEEVSVSRVLTYLNHSKNVSIQLNYYNAAAVITI